MLETATIIEDYGRRFVVQTDKGLLLEANTRKKRTDFVCGDRVHIQQINNHQAVIEDYLPRQSLLFRQDEKRTKLLAANVTQVFVITAILPEPNLDLLQRTLLACNAANIPAFLIINKMDLLTDKEQDREDFYRHIFRLPVIKTIAINNDISDLKNKMRGACNILVGQSGVGKSQLTNAILGENKAKTGDISLNEKGKHTTTFSKLYQIDEHTSFIDTPGMQSFGLNHLSIDKLLYYFPDMRRFIGKCRFHNCHHLQEPDCAIKNAAQNGEINQERLLFLQKIIREKI